MHFAILNRLCAGLILLYHASQFLLRLQALLKLRFLLLQIFLDLSPFHLQPLERCCEHTVLLFNHRVPLSPFHVLITQLLDVLLFGGQFKPLLSQLGL